MSHNEEVQIVKLALELEKDSFQKSKKLKDVENEKFATIQPAPQKRAVQKPPYPAVTSTVKINWVMMLVPACVLFILGTFLSIASVFLSILFTLGAWGWIIFYFVNHSKLKKQNILDIQNSPEYKDACMQIDSSYQNELSIAEKEYMIKLDEYNKTIVPEYNKKLAIWNAQHEIDLKQAQTEFTEADTKLKEHYSSTLLIPAKYHDIHVLEYIFSIISSSQYSFREAVEDYERNVTRQLEMEKINIAEQQAMLTSQQNDLLDAQNDLLDEQNTIAEKTRRDQNMANIVGAVQRHNTNKTLNSINKTQHSTNALLGSIANRKK